MLYWSHYIPYSPMTCYSQPVFPFSRVNYLPHEKYTVVTQILISSPKYNSMKIEKHSIYFSVIFILKIVFDIVIIFMCVYSIQLIWFLKTIFKIRKKKWKKWTIDQHNYYCIIYNSYISSVKKKITIMGIFLSGYSEIFKS